MNMILAIIFLLIFQSVRGLQNDPPVTQIRENLQYYSSFARPQKVYLHSDKSEYKAGETMWFKAYLFDGISHRPWADSSNIYVELIDADGNTMEMRILLAQEGFAAGEIPLRPELPDGNYVIRAYTDWMRNFDEEFFYTRYLYINNPEYENMIPRSDMRSNRRFNRKLRRMSGEHQPETFPGRVADFFATLFSSWDYQAAFFPESGNLIEGTANRVAFRIVDPLGHGQSAEAEIIGRNGEVVSRFKTDAGGIGIFEIEPGEGVKYVARVTVNGQTESYDLPEARAEGYALRVDREEGQIRINVVSTVSRENPLYSGELILIGHTRGEPRFGRSFSPEQGAAGIIADKGSFPSGVAHFTLFTLDHIPVAERLVFINHGDELAFSPRIRSAMSDESEYFDIKLTVRDSMDNPVEGSFSLSAVTGNPGNDVHQTDMLSYLLFDSELKGIKDDVSGYIHSGEDHEEIIDKLLLTHGWRRFDWGKVVERELPEIRIDPTPGLTLAGRIFDPAKNESLRNYPVDLRIVKDEDDEVLSARTGRNGDFAFDRLFFKGNTRVMLTSRRLPGNYPPVIELNVREGRGYDYEPTVYTREQDITGRGDDWSRQRGVSRSPYGHTTSRDVTPQLYGTPDQTIYIDYDKTTERNLFEVLRHRATGLMFDGNRIMLRGPSSIMLSNEPRFMLDGSFIDRNTFLGFYPRDIERIEIFRGTRAAIFGIRGGTGVILAYSRRPGNRGFEDALELVMLGYHTPSEFYTDRVPVSGMSSLDRRIGKTVLWDPDLVSDEEGGIDVRIPLRSGMDRVMLRVEGAGFDGGTGSAGFTIDIEE